MPTGTTNCLPRGRSVISEGETWRLWLITVQDVAEGCNVGALTIAVTSGTQTAATLEQAGPAAVLSSVAELPEYLLKHGYIGAAA